MQKKYIVRLNETERQTLNEVVKKLKVTSQKVRRAQILLKADADGPAWTDAKIAEAFNCRVQTIEKLRKRLVTEGFDLALNGKKRQTPPTQPLLDGRGQPIKASKSHGKRVDYEYERNGTASIFMFVEPLAGYRQAMARARRTKVEWA